MAQNPMTTPAADSSTLRIGALPMPKPDPVLYASVIEEGFRRFPERKANWDLYKRSARGEAVPYQPIKLDIENVSRCNFRCTMCQVSDWPKMKRADDMTLADFKALLDAQAGLTEIKIQGMGEPLLAAEPYFEMIRYARSRSLWVRSTTNASLLHLKENYKKLVETDICEIQVSIDGATASTYEAIRRGGKFKRVVANCEKLNAHARADGRHRTRMWVVVQKENFDEIEMFPDLAARIGFARLTLSLDLNDWGQQRWRAMNDTVDMQREFDISRALAMVERARGLGVDLSYWFIDKKYDFDDPTHLCPWPFERAYISSDMRVVPCCMVSNPEVSDLGDARSLTAVWNGDTMREFRRAHMEGRIPDFCKSCYRPD